MRCIGSLALGLALFTLPAGSASAEPLLDMTRLADAGLDLIGDDLASGRISATEAAVQRFYRLLRPDDGDPRYSLGETTGEPICATSLLAELHALRRELSPLQRHHVAETTDPTYRAWVADGGITWLDGDVDTARSTERSTCFSPSDLNLGTYGNQTLSEEGWFEIHWNESANVTEQRIGWMSGWFDDAFEVEVHELGFFAPTNITSYELLVVVEPLGGSVYGYTGLARCGFEYMPYIVMNASQVDDQVALRPTAAHELFHAIQQVYSFEEFWLSEERPNAWFLEASAVYAATVTNPFDAQRHALHAIRWAIEPYKSMTTHDAGGFQYGMVVWPLSLADGFEDLVWHRDFWESLRDRTGFLLRDEFDDFLRDRGSSFDEAYRRFIRDAATGAQSEFAAGVLYASQFSDDSLAGDHDEGDYPIERSVDGDSRAERPRYLGQNYVFFDSDDVERGTALHLEVWVDGEKGGTSVEWIAEVIALEDDDVFETHSLEFQPHDVDDDGRAREWRGGVLFNDFRSSSDGVLLGVSPVTDFGDGGISWGYTATIIESEGDPGFAEPPAPPADDGDDGEGAACAGCGAHTGPRPAGPPALALLAAFIPGLRRRRSGSAI